MTLSYLQLIFSILFIHGYSTLVTVLLYHTSYLLDTRSRADTVQVLIQKGMYTLSVLRTLHPVISTPVFGTLLAPLSSFGAPGSRSRPLLCLPCPLRRWGVDVLACGWTSWILWVPIPGATFLVLSCCHDHRASTRLYFSIRIVWLEYATCSRRRQNHLPRTFFPIYASMESCAHMTDHIKRTKCTTLPETFIPIHSTLDGEESSKDGTDTQHSRTSFQREDIRPSVNYSAIKRTTDCSGW